jgi:hypothetical protein
VEIEAGDLTADKTKEELLQQCQFYLNAFGIAQTDLIECSYSDMVANV